MAPKNRAEYRKTVADAFVGVLTEKGLNWREEWDTTVSAAPQNAVTGARYHGVNQFYLYILALSRGYTDPRWATMTQIMDKNGVYHKGEKWHLQAGSKAVFVEYWYPYDKLERKQLSWKAFRALPAAERADDRYMLRVRYTPVFHASMIDGLAPLKVEMREPQELSDIVMKLSQSMGVEILNDGGNRAFYRLSEDKIHLPASAAFHGEYEYNATALHELAHSTGHPTRLDRPMTGRFGSEEYAFEELIAEITSCFMSVDLDVKQMPQHMENHKAYVKSWIDAIKEKPEKLTDAIAQAQRAAAYMDFHAGLITEQQYNASLGERAAIAENAEPTPDIVPVSEETPAQVPEESNSAADDYRLLDRLRSDCEYFLGAGNHEIKHLWAGNIEDQIAKMREVYNRLSEKPEWLSSEDIDRYEQSMLHPEQAKSTESALSPDVLGSYEVHHIGPKTWPLDTEYGEVQDFRDYVQKSERALGGNVIVNMPDDANEYVTQLITEGKIRVGDAAYVAASSTFRDGQWERGLGGEYMPGPYGESYLATPDAAGMKKLLKEWYPNKDFDLQKDVDSKHVLLTEQMKALGYEPAHVDGFSDDFLMWKDTATGREFGVDGWEGVQAIVEDRAELATYVGKKVTWDGELYDVEAVRDNRLSLKSTVTGYYRDPTLSELLEHGAVVTEELTPNEDTYSIYQLRRNLDADLRRDLSFEPISHLAARGLSVDLANYECVYTAGELGKDEHLDDIYEKFNIDRPEDFTGHSLSVSDIIVTVRNGETRAFYVDSVGFNELPDIAKELEELGSYVGAKIEWDGESYEAIGTNGNRLILQSVNDDYHTEVTLSQIKLETSELATEKIVTVETNIGTMPIADYRDIVAQQHGYEDYADMRKDGVMLGNGYDDPTMSPAKSTPEYEYAELFGKGLLISYSRIEQKDVPEGWFKYELRNVEGTLNKRLEHRVVMGFAGTVLSPEQISIPEASGYRDIIHSDIHYTDHEMTVDEFRTMRENEIQSEKSMTDFQYQPWQPPEEDADLEM